MITLHQTLKTSWIIWKQLRKKYPLMLLVRMPWPGCISSQLQRAVSLPNVHFFLRGSWEFSSEGILIAQLPHLLCFITFGIAKKRATTGLKRWKIHLLYLFWNETIYYDSGLYSWRHKLWCVCDLACNTSYEEEHEVLSNSPTSLRQKIARYVSRDSI